MSVSTEMDRLRDAKQDMAAAIEGKGVTVPAGATIDTYGALIDQIALSAPAKRNRYACVIGTTQSGHTESDCDYLCTGAADQAKFNSAILAANGAPILVLNGTYTFTAAISAVRDVTLEGSGRVVIKRGFNATTTASTNGLFMPSGTNTYSFDNISFDGNYGTYTGQYNNIIAVSATTANCKIVLKNCSLYSSGTHIRTTAGNNTGAATLTLKDCSLTESAYFAIAGINFIASIANTTATNTTPGGTVIMASSIEMESCTANGIISAAGGTGQAWVKNCKITAGSISLPVGVQAFVSGNYIDCTGSKSAIAGLLASGIMTNNYISNCTVGYGISNPPGTGAPPTVISGNIIRDCKSGIGQTSTNTYVSIRNNIILKGAGTAADYAANEYSIRLVDGTSNCTVENNEVWGKDVTDQGVGNVVQNNRTV